MKYRIYANTNPHVSPATKTSYNTSVVFKPAHCMQLYINFIITYNSELKCWRYIRFLYIIFYNSVLKWKSFPIQHMFVDSLLTHCSPIFLWYSRAYNKFILPRYTIKLQYYTLISYFPSQIRNDFEAKWVYVYNILEDDGGFGVFIPLG